VGLFYATMIMSNKIIDKDLLQKLYKEAKNTMLLLDFIDIAREDAMRPNLG